MRSVSVTKFRKFSSVFFTSSIWRNTWLLAGFEIDVAKPGDYFIFDLGREQILITYEYKGALRLVNLASNEEAPVGSWMGWSNGRWEGDTLVVDVTGFNGYAWFDRAGNFATDALHVVERWTPMGPNHLQYEATIEDPNVYTRPWTISFPIYRRLEPNVQLMEFNCVTYAEEIMYTPLGLYNPPAR